MDTFISIDRERAKPENGAMVEAMFQKRLHVLIIEEEGEEGRKEGSKKDEGICKRVSMTRIVARSNGR